MRNGIADGYLRPFAWRGSEMMAVSAQQTTIHVAIAAWPWPPYFGDEARTRGIKLAFGEYRRPGPTPRRPQQGGRPLHDLHPIEAQGRGRGLSRRPDAGLAAAGWPRPPAPTSSWRRTARCTRRPRLLPRRHHPAHGDRVGQGARHEVIERAIMPDELGAADEAFLTGTAAEVTPIAEIAPPPLPGRPDHADADRGLREGS